MKWIVPILSLYLTYYTFVYARMTWKGGNRLAGVFILLLAGCFPPLALYLNMR